MKVVNLLLAVLFVVFAFLQINDPDPALWILIYGVMAVTCILAAFGYYYPKVLIGILIVYAVYSLTYWSSIFKWLKADNKAMLFDDVAKMENLYIEESREFLGLFICMLILIMHLIMARYRRRHI
jgi:Transmembrane family 220, helix